MAIDIAKELGIDVQELLTESPDHPIQLQLKRQHENKAHNYWAFDRHLAQTDRPEKVSETPAPKKQRRKTAPKLRRYEFTDRQLEIALGVLNAHDNV